MSDNFQAKLGLLDAAWQIARNMGRELDGLLRANPQHGSVLSNARERARGIEANLSNLRELIQGEEEER